MVIHQRPHIERAYETFITDKVAASKSPAIQRPAVSDRDSKFHYSKITLAANDDERQKMSSVPYLAGLATMMYKVHFTSGHLNYHTSFLGQFMHDPSQMAWLAVQEIIIYDYYNRHVDVIMYGGEPSIPRLSRSDVWTIFSSHSVSCVGPTPLGYSDLQLVTTYLCVTVPSTGQQNWSV